MVEAVNRVRSAPQTCGGTRLPAAPPVAWNGRLGAAARAHTADMAQNGFFAHVGSDGSQPGDRATRTGYVWRTVGENIAAEYESVDAVMAAWMRSDGHCRNLMDPRFAELGAAEQDGRWTQLFALPR